MTPIRSATTMKLTASTRPRSYRLPDADRSFFDFKLCHPNDGWAQLDTTKDAPRFGIWTNPIGRVIVRFYEGEVTTERFSTIPQFTAALRAHVNLHRNNGSFLRIDPRGSVMAKNLLAKFGFAADFSRMWS